MNAAYAAEDAIESHIVKVIKTYPREETKSISSEEEDDQEEETRSTESNFVDEETRSRESNEVVDLEASCTNLHEDLHQVIEEMDMIKKVAMKIDAEKEEVPDFPLRSSSMEQRQRQNATMVCCDDVLLEVMEKLASGGHRQVIPVTGMGGIGKTTLAITVYSKPFVKEYFDICAWVTISQNFNTREILGELLCQATNRKKEEPSGDDVGSALHRYLFGRRFLIVMDDMWSIDAWDEIQRFFPDNENGSRVLVTTRLSQLTSQLTNDYSLEMKFLDGVRSWELFSKTVFGEESCPLELKEIGERIVRDCKGLPLSIVVVGGVLKKVEHTRERWESIRKDLTSVVNLENDEHCLRLLKLSYNHLPAYLKPCFLYMGVFEEDDRIRVSMLVKLWVSEGFLKPTNGETLETTAQGFVRDLIDRNLILIDGLKRCGDVKYCKIHDLLRDLCLREARKYGFYEVKGQYSIHQGINSQRRLVIPWTTSVSDELRSMPLARSIILEYQLILSCRPGFGLLRILHDYKFVAYAGRCDMNSLAFEWVNLRHFVGQVNNMSSFLSSIILFWNLHTLIVDCLHECKAPIEIWKMAQFRHIEFVREPLYLPYPVCDGQDDDIVNVVMENLQILKGVKDFKCGEEVVKRCPNLRKLRIRYSNHVIIHSDQYYSRVDIERLCKLESLFITNIYKSMRDLTFPRSLKSLSLLLTCDSTELEDMLRKIGSLPLLQKLKLEGANFGAGKWEMVEGQFPCLKYLSLRWQSGLRHWTTAQEGSSIFPSLEHLRLEDIEELERIPSEIGEIATLQKIELVYCCESVVMSVREIVDEQVELQGEEDLSFHVVVRLWGLEAWERSLAGPNFEVN